MRSKEICFNTMRGCSNACQSRFTVNATSWRSALKSSPTCRTLLTQKGQPFSAIGVGKPHVFYLIDMNRVQQLRTLTKIVPKILEVETDDDLTPIMYAMLKRKWKIVNVMASIDRPPSRFKDTILLGILVGDVSAVSIIIRTGEFEMIHEAALFFRNYLTPLMYACHCNHYGMVRMLCQRRYKFPVPHLPNCACKVCVEKLVYGDELFWILTRLGAYEAMCSHAYLLQSRLSDPFRYAFRLSAGLEICKEFDPINADAYDRMARHAGRLPIALLNSCETDDEVTLIFNQTSGLLPDAYTDLPLLRLAVDTKQKEFLSDPICLKMLKKHWMGGWHDWSDVDVCTKAYRILFHTVLYPITSVVYVLSNGDLAVSYDYPVARFVSFVTSYLLFLICLIVLTQHQEVRNLRGPPDSPVKKLMLYYIWSYMGGMFIVLWTDMHRRQWRGLFDAWWRCFDFIQIIIYGFSYCAHRLSVSFNEVYEEPYLHRVHWDTRHPTLVFEMVFTCAAIMSSWRLFYFLQLHRALGPLVISVGRCTKDIFNFVALFILVTFCFALSLSFIMEHYASRESNHVAGFWRQSMALSMKFLYWALYGYLDPERLEQILGKHADNQQGKHFSLHVLGELLVAAYYIVMVVSLLNAMISMMAGSAGEILDRRHAEWSYVRCQVWCEYFEDIRAVPPPICVLQLVINIPTWFCRRLCGSYKKLSMWDVRYTGRNYSTCDRRKYLSLMERVRKRFLARFSLEEISKVKLPAVAGLGVHPAQLRGANLV
uniref:Transient receptor ion channel domain-containing protein n=1 Tax=Trichuris muris TaxID=70415 RepID=A0A5S6QD70_TRIMR